MDAARKFHIEKVTQAKKGKQYVCYSLICDY